MTLWKIRLPYLKTAKASNPVITTVAIIEAFAARVLAISSMTVMIPLIMSDITEPMPRVVDIFSPERLKCADLNKGARCSYDKAAL